jgi:hypothetical protein
MRGATTVTYLMQINSYEEAIGGQLAGSRNFAEIGFLMISLRVRRRKERRWFPMHIPYTMNTVLQNSEHKYMHEERQAASGYR